ncbi:hypothetical protein FB461_1710 [Rarobacter faecitabidus]|uniref:Uncharacterized protein n=1 Tax=Rarobacter faecitabidus TaxID=13243 RepID=A0A542ZP87_RARFA|nr:hypothetical protein FB461_1710 [Rarobacter faecitabidus]
MDGWFQVPAGMFRVPLQEQPGVVTTSMTQCRRVDSAVHHGAKEDTAPKGEDIAHVVT